MFIFRLFEGGIVLKMIDRHTNAFYLRRYRAPPPANLVIAQNRKKVFKNIFLKKGALEIEHTAGGLAILAISLCLAIGVLMVFKKDFFLKKNKHFLHSLQKKVEVCFTRRGSELRPPTAAEAEDEKEREDIFWNQSRSPLDGLSPDENLAAVVY